MWRHRHVSERASRSTGSLFAGGICRSVPFRDEQRHVWCSAAGRCVPAVGVLRHTVPPSGSSPSAGSADGLAAPAEATPGCRSRRHRWWSSGSADVCGRWRQHAATINLPPPRLQRWIFPVPPLDDEHSGGSGGGVRRRTEAGTVLPVDRHAPVRTTVATTSHAHHVPAVVLYHVRAGDAHQRRARGRRRRLWGHWRAGQLRLPVAQLRPSAAPVQGQVQAGQPHSSPHRRETIPVSVPRLRQSVRTQREPQDTQAHAHWSVLLLHDALFTQNLCFFRTYYVILLLSVKYFVKSKNCD